MRLGTQDRTSGPFPGAEMGGDEMSAPMNWSNTTYRTLDLALVPLLSLLALPIMVVMVIAVRLTSPGPAIYRQVRVGRRGRLFTIYKIRTMVQNFERGKARWTAAGSTDGVTPVGRFLRKMHLDELPQLWNILRGDMSLVGPRPERPEFVTQLEAAIPGYRGRLAVRPGVTGLAQVHLPPDTSVEDVKHKLLFDLYYIRHRSLWLDLRLIGCSGFYLLQIPFYKSCRWLRIPAPVRIEAHPPKPAELAEIQSHALEGESAESIPVITTITQLRPEVV